MRCRRRQYASCGALLVILMQTIWNRGSLGHVHSAQRLRLLPTGSANNSLKHSDGNFSSESCVNPILNTLTFDCQQQCSSYRPCIQYKSFEDCQNAQGGDEESIAMSMCVKASNSSCGFECFSIQPNDTGTEEYKSFTFFIQGDDDVYNTSDTVRNVYPSKNDDVLQKIAAFRLPNFTTDFTLVGDTLLVGVKGQSAAIKLESTFLRDEVHLQAVTLANINIQQLANNMLPASLLNLTLVNCFLTDVPDDLLDMTELQNLNLSQNYLAEYPVKFGSDSLLSLDLSHNNMANFIASFPNLTYLDLFDNALSAIPYSIFNMSNLQYLDLRSNSFNEFEVSETNYKFLTKIPTLYIDPSTELDCDVSYRRQLHGITICICNKPVATTDYTGLTIGISGSVFALAMLGSIIWRHRRHRMMQDKAKRIDYTQEGTEPSSESQGKYHNKRTVIASTTGRSLWDDEELALLQVCYDDIEDIRRIGSGAFGVVWLARYRNRDFVASKRLKKDEINAQMTRSFIEEIKLVARLDHPCIVSLKGVAWTVESNLQALFEYMVNGDLRSYLTSFKPKHNSWTQEKLAIATNIAEALVYLHSFAPPIVHRDLKSRNVLLGRNMEAKLSDFGVARLQSEHNTMTNGVGTGKWLAPEVLSGSGDYNQFCDIYSFGVVLSEMDTHELPYENMRGQTGNPLPDIALLQMVASGIIRPRLSPGCPPGIMELAQKCLSFEPEERPTAIEAAYALRSIHLSADNGNDYFVL